MLCQWCQENAFDIHTLTLLEHAYQGYRTNPDDTPGAEVRWTVDPVAYFTGGDIELAPLRILHRKRGSLERDAEEGCIFCSQLQAVIQEGPRPVDPNNQYVVLVDGLEEPDQKSDCDDDDDDDVDDVDDDDLCLNIRILTPWKSCSVKVGPEDPDAEARISMPFRLYLKEETFLTEPPTDNSLLSQAQGRVQLTCTPDWDRDRTGLLQGLEACLTYHSVDCKQPAQEILPTRLLKITGSPTSPDMCLIETAQISSPPVRYACLSYCWGGPQPNATTVARLSGYLQGIDVNSIPKTVYDAAKVSLSLGVEYLLVDSYCIVQDSGRDKTAELNKMSSIYAGAHFTICAMSARAATDGFLGIYEGQANEVTTWNVNISDAQPRRTAVLEMRSDGDVVNYWKQPLIERGWTYQEALLSPRLLMFFSDGQLPALRCNTHVVRSDGTKATTYPKPLMHIDTKIFETPQIKSYDLQANAGMQWAMIVQQYTKRALTFPTDKALALMGIVCEVEKHSPLGKYSAGLWSTTMRDDLLWESPRNVSPRAPEAAYIGPSWSWLSRHHAVRYPFRQDMCDSAEDAQISCEVIPADPAVPNGAVKSATLTVRCIANLVDNVSDWPAIFTFDDDPVPPGLGQLWLLNIADYEPYNNFHPIGLGVVEVENTGLGGEKLYRRVGMFHDSRRDLADGTWREFKII